MAFSGEEEPAAYRRPVCRSQVVGSLQRAAACSKFCRHQGHELGVQAAFHAGDRLVLQVSG